MRDLSTTIATYGKTVVVLNSWRNASATAFVECIVEDFTGRRFHADAKSQGPSSGGYNKEQQALERLASKLKLPGTVDRPATAFVQAFANAIAQVGESARVKGCLPCWLEAGASRDLERRV